MKQVGESHWHHCEVTTCIMAFLFFVGHATGQAQAITRGSTTGNTTAPGYNDPNQLLTVRDEKPAPNMYPHVMRPEQEAAARRKLNAQLQKVGKKPNVLIVLMDDVGWSDLGFMGGGVAFGQPTPIMDRYASQGLVLTSAYSTPSCTPSRASLLTGQDPLHHGLLRPAAPGEPGGLSDPMTLPMVLQK